MKKNSLLLIIFVTLLLSYRLLNFIINYSVNIPYDDQWWVADMIVEKKPLKDLLFYLYSEHRIGVGLILMKSMAILTHWNTRYENFGVGVTLIILTLLALALKFKITKNIAFTDITIPIIFLNLHQYENLMEGFRIMYLIPVILLFIYFWLMENDTYWKNIAIIVLVFLSTFSGFHGLFLNIFVIFSLISQIINEKINQKIIIKGLMLSFIIILTFSYFSGFTANHSDFTFPSIFDLFAFPIGMINGVTGLKITFPFNLLLPLLSSASFIFFLYFYLKSKKFKLTPILLLYLYSFLFILSITFGRNKFGIELAAASRYVSLMVLLYFAVYLTFTIIPNKIIKNLLLAIILIPILFIILFNNSENYNRGMTYKINKTNWMLCYLREKSVSYCNDFTGYYLLGEKFNYYLESKLEFLKKNKLSFFTEI